MLDEIGSASGPIDRTFGSVYTDIVNDVMVEYFSGTTPSPVGLISDTIHSSADKRYLDLVEKGFIDGNAS